MSTDLTQDYKIHLHTKNSYLINKFDENVQQSCPCNCEAYTMLTLELHKTYMKTFLRKKIQPILESYITWLLMQK